MAKFMLHFERYVQMRAMVEVDAKDLVEVMAMADAIDVDTLGWDHDQEDTVPRLYGVLDDQDMYVAQVQLPQFTWSFSWTHVDLRDQWSMLDMPGPEIVGLYPLDDQLEDYFRKLVPRLAVNRHQF